MPTSLDTQLIPYVAAFAATLLFLALLWIRAKRAANLAAKKQHDRLSRQEKELATVNKQLLEVRSVVIGLGQKVSEQQDIIQLLNDRIRELENNDNDGRLYSRASKMVKLGADVNELIQECELPKAEAELMMSLQNKIANKQEERAPSRAPSRRAPAPRAEKQQPSGYPPKRPLKR
jgi:predicted  nucleic acid-binding Zn-ribbon protein